jgi:hypothetical protein
MRYTFGGQVSDNVIQSPSANGNTVKVLPNQSGGTAWSAQTGGSNLTASCMAIGTDPAPVCTDTDGFVRPFQGPDGIQTLWVDFGGTRRFLKGREVGTSSDAALTTAAGLDSASANLVSTSSSTRTAIDARYYVRGDLVYRVADYATEQAAIDAAPAGAVVLFYPGNTPTRTSPLSISKPITLRGQGAFGTRLIVNGCNGINVAAGVSDFHMENIEVAQATRYSTTANTFVGINVDGATGSRPANHVYRDVYVDGFKTAFQTRYLWSSTFDNARSNYGLIGLDVYGLSVNNVIHGNSQLSVAGGAGSKGIRFAGQESATDATAVQSEGWVIADSLIYGAETGIDIIGTAHVYIHGNIIDFNTLYGIRISGNGTAFGGNANIHDNYIAMNGSGGTAAIQSANTVANAANTWNDIHDNHCIVYSGQTCTYGLNQSGGAGLMNAHDNTLNGFGTADIFTQSSGNRIVGNRCQSSLTNNISFIDGQTNEISGNVGKVYLPGSGNIGGFETVAGRKVAYGLGAPTVATWAVGDRCVNASPAVGSPKAWVCTVAGTPGTWVSEGNL